MSTTIEPLPDDHFTQTYDRFQITIRDPNVPVIPVGSSLHMGLSVYIVRHVAVRLTHSTNGEVNNVMVVYTTTRRQADPLDEI